jgi:NlpC/P60 family putative phage cell wall peptidase
MSSTSDGSYSMTQADLIVALAREWAGTPYRHQASLKGIGCDCLGLVRGVWREAYGEEPEDMPAYEADWAESRRGEVLADAAARHMQRVHRDGFAEGDLLLFRWRPWLPAKHAGIAISRTRMIHAQDGRKVCEAALSLWWKRRLAFAFRFPDVRR